jgi:hypothetical protein
MASNSLTNLRGSDPGANRQTDAIARLVEPVAKAVMSTPIMGAKPPAWIQPQLGSGFVNVGGGWAPTRYHKSALGYVYVQSFVTAPAGVAGYSTITTLPPGYRPDLDFVSIANSNTGHSVVVMTSVGVLYVVGALAAGEVLAFNFSFLSER